MCRACLLVSIQVLVQWAQLWSSVYQQTDDRTRKTSLTIRPILGNPSQSWILDSSLWIPDSRYWIPVFVSRTWILDSNRQWDSGFHNPWFRIPYGKTSRIPEFESPYMGWDDGERDWPVQKFGLRRLQRLDTTIQAELLFLFLVNSRRQKEALLWKTTHLPLP